MKKEAKPKPAETKVEPFESLLRCNLTDEQLIARGNEMSEAIQEGANLKEMLDSVKKEYQAKIDQRAARISELSGTIRAKSESRLVPCERRFNYKDGVVEEFRTDTNERINSRPMKTEERQATLDIPA